jgi:hypothetical protein
MSYPETAIDQASVELNGLAKSYAEKAAKLASDPYFKEAVVKVSVAGFAWALYHAFDDEFSRAALNQELKIQSAAVDRAVAATDKASH